MAETKGLEPVLWVIRCFSGDIVRTATTKEKAAEEVAKDCERKAEPLYSTDAIERLEREKRMLRAAKDDCFNAAKEAQESLSAAQAEIEQLRDGLRDAERTMKNSRGAIETNQIDDKDVRRQLTLGIERARSLIGGTDAG